MDSERERKRVEEGDEERQMRNWIVRERKKKRGSWR